MSLYDKEYQQEDLFGKPYKELVSFFKEYSKKGQVLDMGCGQGRDSLALAKLGYKVSGIDSSKVGIEQMLKKAKKSKLKLTTIIDDFFTFVPKRKYDVILLDSILHFYKKDTPKETEFLQRIFNYVKKDGLICVFVHKSNPRERHLKNIFKQSKLDWEILVDKHIDFVWKTHEMQYRMFFAKKNETRKSDLFCA